MNRPWPNVSALAVLAVDFGDAVFGERPTALSEPSKLEAELRDWLFDDRRAIWKLLSAGLISEREARDLLLRKVFDCYRQELSQNRANIPPPDSKVYEAFDLALFGHRASEKPPPG